MNAASAHGISSVAYATVTEGAEEGDVRVELGLEYDLMLVSVADTQGVEKMFYDVQPLWEDRDYDGMLAAVTTFADPITAYVAGHLTVTRGGVECTPTMADVARMDDRQEVPYAFIPFDFHCDGESHLDEVTITSTLFPDSEEYVKNTKVIMEFDVAGASGSAVIDAADPEFSSLQSWAKRFATFFHLGAEHLYLGIDHVLFLLALIVGSRSLREIVLVATAFTVAHSITFILAALGVVTISGGIVEPVIALSIAAVAAWYLYRLWRYGDHATDLEVASGSHFALDRAGWSRIGVVFGFGLIHGLGFAGALGIDEPFSWTLLWSLLVFNIGIEVVQIGFIVVLFPLLTLLRRTSPKAGLVVTGAVAAFVAFAGLYWFFARIGVPLPELPFLGG